MASLWEKTRAAADGGLENTTYSLWRKWDEIDRGGVGMGADVPLCKYEEKNTSVIAWEANT